MLTVAVPTKGTDKEYGRMETAVPMYTFQPLQQRVIPSTL